MIDQLKVNCQVKPPGALFYLNDIIPDDSKPLIAISLDQYQDANGNFLTYTSSVNVQKYFNLFTMYGANLLILNFQDDVHSVAAKIDGYIIPGGTDMDPSFYNEPQHEKSNTKQSSKFRCQYEHKLLQALPKNCPVFGICYGSQFLNVVNGGTLNQHIEQHEQHLNQWGTVTIEPDTELFKIIGKNSMKSYCFHHQLANKIGNGLKINCYSQDGLVHGLEKVNDEEWKFSIQWHPERTEGDEDNFKLGAYFVEKCQNYKQNKKK